MKALNKLSPWYHSIKLPDGSYTPGKINTEEKFHIIKRGLPNKIKGLSVLDLGSSSGGLALEYAHLGAIVTGIEAKKLEVEQCNYIFEKYGYRGKFFRDDVMNAYKYGFFDIINACGLLYHLPNPVLFLDMLAVICKKKLILSTRICPEKGLGMILKRNEDNGNWWFPSEEAILQMLKISGFINVKILSINGDRSNIFCVADAPRQNMFEKFKTFFQKNNHLEQSNLLEHLITNSTPSSERIVSKSSKNDLPD